MCEGVPLLPGAACTPRAQRHRGRKLDPNQAQKTLSTHQVKAVNPKPLICYSSLDRRLPLVCHRKHSDSQRGPKHTHGP